MHKILVHVAAFLILIVATISPPADSSLAGLRKLDDVALANLIDTSKAVVSALERVGQPISSSDLTRLRAAWKNSGDQPMAEIQDILNRYCLIDILIDEEGWLKASTATADPGDRTLIQGKWKYFLVRVYNQSGVKAPIEVRSPQQLLPEELRQAEGGVAPTDTSGNWYRWLGLKKVQMAVNDFPGHTVQYLVLGVFSRDQGKRFAELEFYYGGGAVAQGHYVRKRVLFFSVAEPQIERRGVQ